MKYYTDGFCLGGNPSKLGGGYTLTDDKGKVVCWQKILRFMTNNEAELLGCLRALQIAEEGDTIITDSKVVISWVYRPDKKKRKRKDLDDIKKECNTLINIKRIEVKWEPREGNLAGKFNERMGYDGRILSSDRRNMQRKELTKILKRKKGHISKDFRYDTAKIVKKIDMKSTVNENRKEETIKKKALRKQRLALWSI